MPKLADVRLGAEPFDVVARLFSLCRSITGDGARRTLEIVGERAPLTPHEGPTGTEVFAWTVPWGWNIRDAWIAKPSGRRVVDFQESNPHIVGYGIPPRAAMTLEQLRPHLHPLPEQPSLAPYYAETWGFCLSQDTVSGMDEGLYEVCIDSTLAEGHLTYGEFLHDIADRSKLPFPLVAEAAEPLREADPLKEHSS